MAIGVANQAARLRKLLAEPTPAAREAIAAALKATNAVAYARHRADELAAEAADELECLPESECRGILESLTKWTTRREA